MSDFHVEYRIEVDALTAEEAVDKVAEILATGGARRGAYHVMQYDGKQVALREGELVIDLDDSDERECSRCGDEVQILNSRDECMGCEEERANGDVCSRCDETIDWTQDMHAFKDRVEPDGVLSVCGSCAHNERRSG